MPQIEGVAIDKDQGLAVAFQILNGLGTEFPKSDDPVCLLHQGPIILAEDTNDLIAHFLGLSFQPYPDGVVVEIV